MPSWRVTVVCGASGTGRSTFAAALAERFRGRVVDSHDVLVAARTVTSPERHPALFYSDAEQAYHSDGEFTQTAEELAAARMRAADALHPTLRKLINGWSGLPPRSRIRPHIVLTGRHVTPALADYFAVVVREPDEEQIHANLLADDPYGHSHRLRAQTSMLVQAELIRRSNDKAPARTIVINARPWETSAAEADRALRDYWDMDTALG